MSIDHTTLSWYDGLQELLKGESRGGPSSKSRDPQFLDFSNPAILEAASNQQLMEGGYKMIGDGDRRLNKMERMVEDTKQIGVGTVENLESQNRKMEEALVSERPPGGGGGEVAKKKI